MKKKDFINEIKKHSEIFNPQNGVFLDYDKIPSSPKKILKKTRGNGNKMVVWIPIAAACVLAVVFFVIPFKGTTLADSVFETITEQTGSSSHTSYGSGVSMQVQDSGFSEGTADSAESIAVHFGIRIADTKEYPVKDDYAVMDSGYMINTFVDYVVDGATVSMENIYVVQGETTFGSSFVVEDGSVFSAATKDGIEMSGYTTEDGYSYATGYYEKLAFTAFAEGIPMSEFEEFISTIEIVG